MPSIALMQPYFFPYIGYYQLIKSVDKFIIYDNTQYIREGWIHRNRILLDGSIHYISVSVNRGHLSDRIGDKSLEARNRERTARKILSTLFHAYRRAPFFEESIELVESILRFEGDRLLDFLVHSMAVVCGRLGIEAPSVLASAIETDRSGLAGQERVLGICRDSGADLYVNASGGRDLYSRDMFSAQGIELRFLQPQIRPYRQSVEPFVPGLSIVDVMMWNDVEEIRRMLEAFRLE